MRKKTRVSRVREIVDELASHPMLYRKTLNTMALEQGNTFFVFLKNRDFAHLFSTAQIEAYAMGSIRCSVW